jgi:Zn-dependent M32 family carboxypeptidase
MIRNAIEGADKIDEIEKTWHDELEEYLNISSKYHLYA